MKAEVAVRNFLLTVAALVGAASGHAPSEETSPDLKSERILQGDIPLVGIGSIRPINSGSSSESYIAADLIDALERYDQYIGK